MTIEELDAKLDDAVNGFSAEIQAQYSESGKRPVNEGDLHEVARQAFYAMALMNEAIVKYLRDASRAHRV